MKYVKNEKIETPILTMTAKDNIAVKAAIDAHSDAQLICSGTVDRYHLAEYIASNYLEDASSKELAMQDYHAFLREVEHSIE